MRILPLGKCFCHLASVFFATWQIFCHLASDFFAIWQIFCHLASVFFAIWQIFCHLASDFFAIWQIFCHLASDFFAIWQIFCHLASDFFAIWQTFSFKTRIIYLTKCQKMALLRFHVTLLGPMLRIFPQNRNTILARPRLGFSGVCYDVTYFCGI